MEFNFVEICNSRIAVWLDGYMDQHCPVSLCIFSFLHIQKLGFNCSVYQLLKQSTSSALMTIGPCKLQIEMTWAVQCRIATGVDNYSTLVWIRIKTLVFRVGITLRCWVFGGFCGEEFDHQVCRSNQDHRCSGWLARLWLLIGTGCIQHIGLLHIVDLLWTLRAIAIDMH